jgi:carotenoid 1,2-hydratase
VFRGSVFSPYYARARRRGPADPDDHCAFNVALNGRVNRWAMTERPRRQVRAERSSLQIGPSVVDWDGNAFNFRIAEATCPVPTPLRGTVRVQPLITPGRSFALDAAGRHTWTPLAPRARVSVQFTQPRLCWQGEAYLDSNAGVRPLEHDFAGWTWSRAAMNSGTSVFYDVQHREDTAAPLALHFDAGGQVRRLGLPERVALAPSRWGISRVARSEDQGNTRLIRTLVDAPFYARSLLATHVAGEAVTSVHESLNLDRLRRSWVQCMLPFRMPRWPLRG